MDDDDSAAFIEYTGDERQRITYRFMLALATLGSIHLQPDDAECTFAALESVVVNRTDFMMVRAVALGLGGGAHKAVELMNQRLQENPDDDVTKVALGVAMLLNDDPEWRFSIDNVLATSMDQPARQAALRTITYVPAMYWRSRASGASLRPA